VMSAPSAVRASALASRTDRSRGASLLTFVRRNPALAASMLLLALVVASALLSPVLPYDAYRQDILHRNAPPSAAHWLPTDRLPPDAAAPHAPAAHPPP